MQINQKFHFKIRELLTFNLQEDISNKFNFNNLSLNSSDLRIFETELINFLKFNDCEKIIRKEIERKTLYNSGTIQINSKDNPISRKDLITAYELTTKKTFVDTSLLEDFNKNSQEVLEKAIEIDLSKENYGLLLMRNFSDFRKSLGYQYSFNQILQNTTKQVRREKRFFT